MAFQVPDYIQSLVPYLPGKPIEETRREYKIKKVVKLASNENPLGASPKAKKAIQAALKDLHRYPDGSGYLLKQALSHLLKTTPQSLILGNGSNEVIEFLIRTYCVPGDSIVTHRAAFIAYKISAQIHGVKTIETPIDSELNPNLDLILSEVKREPRVRLVFLANPNNPTGVYLPESSLKQFVSELAQVRGGSVILVLDYAYWEYVTARDLPDPMPWIQTYPNVVVLRTFSKIYGLGGLRVGYGISRPEVISHLEKVRQPFNLSSLALAGATAALSDHDFVKRSKTTSQKGMKFWEKELTRLKVPYWKSQGNFLLIDTQRGFEKSGMEIHQASLKQGAIFRPVANYGLPHALRLSIGTPEENQFALKILKSFRAKK